MKVVKENIKIWLEVAEENKYSMEFLKFEKTNKIYKSLVKFI